MLTHSARTAPAVHPGMTIFGEKGGSPPFVLGKSYLFCYLERQEKFKIMGKPLLEEKYVEGEKKERIMSSLVATTSTLKCTMCLRMHSVRTN